MADVITTALLSIVTDYPNSADQPRIVVGARELGELRREVDGTHSLYVASALSMGAFTHRELAGTDLLAALVHLQPVADEMVADDLAWEQSRRRYSADRLARGLSSY